VAPGARTGIGMVKFMAMQMEKRSENLYVKRLTFCMNKFISHEGVSTNDEANGVKNHLQQGNFNISWQVED